VIVPNSGIRIEDFCWLADGRIVYTRQESAGTKEDNLWQIGMDPRTGTPATKSKRLTAWAGSELTGLSASADGKRMVLQKRNWQGQVYLGQLAARGKHLSSAARLTNDQADDYPTAWTGDSKAVLFMSFRNGKVEIFKQEVSRDTAEPLLIAPQRALIPRLSGNRFAGSNLCRVSPDGAWVLYGISRTRAARDSSGLSQLLRLPVNGGPSQLVLDTPGAKDWQCSHAPANVCVIIEAGKDQKGFAITAFDPLRGRGKLLRTVERDPARRYAEALSPDGSTLALAKGGESETHIRLLSLHGGSDGEIIAKSCPNVTGLDWSADGKGFYCGSGSSQGGTLVYVHLNGNAQVLWLHRGAGVSSNAVWGIPSPDGHYVAIHADAVTSNVWMVQGF
jgi:Tol biopolymer transport system component